MSETLAPASSPIGVAAIGVGRLGLLHAQNLARRVPGAELRLVVDVDEPLARRTGELCGVRYSTDTGSAFDDPAIGAVVISTSTDTHPDLIARAAAAGKHIFCEKPIALALDEADRAIAAAQQAGVLLQIGFMRRYDPSYVEARRLIVEGRIGRPLTFRSASLDGAISPSRAFLERCGGILLDVALHDLDLACWLMDDEVAEVYSVGSVLVHEVLREVDDVDNAVVTLRFARGGIGVVQVSHTAVYGYDIATEVIGERGAVRAGELRYHDVWHYDAEGRVGHDTMPGFPERFGTAYLNELIDFVACIREGRAPVAGAAEARAALALALAARQSLHERRPVAVAY